MPRVSIIICTCDRAESLRKTLSSLAKCVVPPGMTAQLLVVDNGVAQSAGSVIEQSQIPAMRIQYIRLPPPAGLSRARNRGIAEADGEVLLFTDDDVRPPANWIEEMFRPILERKADAVAGGVRIAEHLLRPWMTSVHRSWLASTEYLDPAAPQEMVGANMAIARHVLQRVPQFDEQLGPGALGQSDDSLFSWQLLRAGYRITSAFDVAVEHHFDPSRLTRSSFKMMALRRGRSSAYLMHHWEHGGVRWPRIRVLRDTMRLRAGRVLHMLECSAAEGMPAWEMSLLARIGKHRQWQREKARPRMYQQFGLVKSTATDESAHPDADDATTEFCTRTSDVL
ncbi:MAG TPA: glycosyltransferase [Tepidisphaeraceae bacterium]